MLNGRPSGSSSAGRKRKASCLPASWSWPTLAPSFGTASRILGLSSRSLWVRAAPMLENTHRLVALVMSAAAERDARWRAQAAQHAASAAAEPAPEQDGMSDAELTARQTLRTFE